MTWDQYKYLLLNNWQADIPACSCVPLVLSCWWWLSEILGCLRRQGHNDQEKKDGERERVNERLTLISRGTYWLARRDGTYSGTHFLLAFPWNQGLFLTPNKSGLALKFLKLFKQELVNVTSALPTFPGHRHKAERASSRPLSWVFTSTSQKKFHRKLSLPPPSLSSTSPEGSL